MQYGAIIFDMDDTLIKTWESKWAHYRLVGKKYYGIEVTNEQLSTHWGEPFPKLVRSIFGEDVGLDEAIQNFLRHDADFPKPGHDAAVEAVKMLHKNGVVLGVVTSMLTDVAEEDIRREFPPNVFDFIQGADQTLAHKPDPLVFEPALRRLEEKGITDKKAILYVGDALSDFYAARDAGLDFIGVTTGFVDETSFTQVGAKRVLASLADLQNSILKG